MSDYYNYTLKLFSKKFNENNRKSKIIRMILKFGFPLEVNGKWYKTINDRI